MAENSAISWTEHTWNPWMGCTKISPACDGCYAAYMMDDRFHKVKWGNHPRVRTSQHNWNEPVRWNRKAEAAGTRPFVFCASLADIFDNQVDPQWRADAFEVMRKTPNLVYLLLTKRPQNIVKMSDAAGGLPRNVALGSTCEDQPRADQNLPALKVAKIELDPLFIFGSYEPMIGGIIVPPEFMPDWVITGGETDQGSHQARITEIGWVRSLRDQAASVGAAFHHKQNGEWLAWDQVMADGVNRNFLSLGKGDDVFRIIDGTIYSKVGSRQAGRYLDGVIHDAFPEPRR